MKSKVIEKQETKPEPVWQFPCVVNWRQHYAIATGPFDGLYMSGDMHEPGANLGSPKPWCMTGWLPITHPVTIEFTP